MTKNYNENEFDNYESNLEDDLYEDDLDELSIYEDLDDMDFDEEDEFIEDYDIYDDDFREVILTLDDDTELKCIVVAQFEVKGQDYIALMPVEDDSNHDILLYRADYGEDEEFEVSLIEDQEEFDLVSEAYYKNVDFDFEEYLKNEEYHDHEHHHHDHHHHDHDEFDDSLRGDE